MSRGALDALALIAAEVGVEVEEVSAIRFYRGREWIEVTTPQGVHRLPLESDGGGE